MSLLHAPTRRDHGKGHERLEIGVVHAVNTACREQKSTVGSYARKNRAAAPHCRNMTDTKQVELEAYLAEKGVKVVFKNLLKVSPLGPQCHASLLHPL